jgi:hypothetical protein
MTLMTRLVSRVTSAGDDAMDAAERLTTEVMVAMIRVVPRSVFERVVRGMDLFVPNELETHLIVFHGVAPEKISSQRHFCRAQGRDYTAFLNTNHSFMHGQAGEGHTHDGA